MEMQRQGLMPPSLLHASRSDNQNNNYLTRSALMQNIKRSVSGGGINGMWFGPRLGRIQKRSSEQAYETGKGGNHH